MAEMDSSSSCGPQANAHPPPPMAHAPTPMGVRFKSLLPSCLVFICGVPTIITEPIPEAVLRQFLQFPLGESESSARQFVFPRKRAAEHGRIIRIEHHRNARVIDAAH